MAAKPIYIPDMGAAILAGTVPGTFEDDRAVFTFPEVVTVNSRGRRQLWTARVRLLQDGRPVPIAAEYLAQPAPHLHGYVGEITTEARNVGPDGEAGPPRAGMTPTLVPGGKNLGKKNATNAASQALRDAFGLYGKKLKRAAPAGPGAELLAGPGAGLPAGPGAELPADPGAELLAAPAPSRPPPMLLKKIGETRAASLGDAEFARGVTAQRKMDGVRLVAYLPKAGERVVFYSRTSGEYPAPSHLAAELFRVLRAPPSVMKWVDAPPAALAAAPPPPYLDGEMYLHGRPLAWISGQARKKDKSDDSAALEFHVFDVFFPDLAAAGIEIESRDRQSYLDALFAANAGPPRETVPHVIRVGNRAVASRAELDAFMAEALAEGFEGVVARKDWAHYRYGYNGLHSDAVVKVKPIYDSEFAVVGYAQGTRGKDVGAVIWIVEVDAEHVRDPDDKTFSVVPKEMSYADRYQVYKCLGEVVEPPAVTRFERDLLGKPLTVEYPGRSPKTGKPVQAKALAFRTYESGPQGDPIRRLLDECG